MTRLTGTGVGTGLGTGPAIRLPATAHVSAGSTPGESTTATDATRPGTSVGGAESAVSATSRDPERERERFEAARDAALDELRGEQQQAATAVGKPGADVLATHESFLTDPALEERVDEELDAGGSAERAVARALETWIEAFESQGGRTAARADDLRDLRGRLLRHLGDRTDAPSFDEIPAGAVVLTDRLGPSTAARLSGRGVAGVATKRGTPDGHAAVLLRAAGVPLVVGVGDPLDELDGGNTVTVDASLGIVSDETATSATGLVSDAAADSVNQSRDGTVTTADGETVRVAATVGSGEEAGTAADLGAAGVALFRSEVLAYRAGGIPSVDDQTAAYRAALDAFPDHSVAIRTFDFGGDKPLPGDDGGESPDLLGAGTGGATSNRGIARSLTMPNEFDDQLTALCRANAEGAGDLVVLLPHVTSVDEVHAARERLSTVAADLGLDPPALGAMVETPAAVRVSPALASELDLLSLGTNDLLAGLYGHARDDGQDRSPDSPSFLRALREVGDAASAADTPLSCCGELAADPGWARHLVALGVDTLGVPPREIGAVARSLDDFDVDAHRERVLDATAASTNSEVSRILTESEGA